MQPEFRALGDLHMDDDASRYIATLATELRKIALRAGLATSVFLLDMLIMENQRRIVEAEERASRIDVG